MNFMKKYVIGLLFVPTMVFAGPNNSIFAVTFTVLPSCQIKTQNTTSNDMNIVSLCSHEDFYITSSSMKDKKSVNENTSLPQKTIIVTKKTVNNEIHTTISDTKDKVLTVNF